MIYPLILAVFLAALFYLGLPAIGAFSVRSRWRAFRRRMTGLSMTPIASYATVAGQTESFSGTRIGDYRFFGGIEAIDRDDRIWVRNDRLSLAVDMAQAQVYSLPMGSTKEEGPEEENDIVFSDDMPERINWNRLVSVPEKTKIFVGGSLFREGGLGVFKAERDSPLIVILYEGEEETILRRCIWSGRQSNEYWNKLTPISISAGIFVMIMLFFSLMRRPIPSIIAFLIGAAAILPIMPILPPGTFFIFVYRMMWRRGRILRAERDSIALPLRYFPPDGKGIRPTRFKLHDGEEYEMTRVDLLDGGVLPEGIRVRGAEVYPLEKKPDFYTVFGAGREGKVVRPKDPMASFVAVIGDPEQSSLICSRKARVAELVSGACILAATLLNGLVFWFVYRAITG